MKKTALILICLTASVACMGRHQIKSPNVKSLEVMVNTDWQKGAVPVMELGTDDVLTVSFDELSHNYHRFTYRVDHCEPDWSLTEGLFESDWLEGFNDLPIDNYANSINTNVLYTHYSFQIPNEQMQLKMSGNYRLTVIDDCHDQQEVLTVELRVVEPLMNVGMSITTNTDVDLNDRYQQVAMTVNFNSVRVTNLQEQIQTFVMQNGREDNMRSNVAPTAVTPLALRWEHCRSLIFEGGSEYHKFEVLDPSHISMGLAYVTWDQEQRRFHAFPFVCQEQRNYIYDQDANGAFILRNSDDYEPEYTSEYVYVHYKLLSPRKYDHATVFIDGAWTTEARENYVMDYDEEEQAYNAVILQKLGYYNYQLLMSDLDGQTHRVPQEGCFFQTENSYQAFVYYRGTGERTWRLVGYQDVVFR